MNPENRILLAEDVGTLRSLIVDLAEIVGLSCDAFESGAAAIESFRTHAYSVVLLDCKMPRMSGYEAARKIREIEAQEKRARTPLVAISSAADEELCREAGMDGWESKPTSPKELRDLIERYGARD